MRIYKCDCCSKEIKRIPKVVSIPCHLWSMKDSCGYVDSEMNAVSGRGDEIDLCQKCYNIAWEAFVRAINQEKS
jgi:hypothetical protein